jgi:hypothetical protein
VAASRDGFAAFRFLSRDTGHRVEGAAPNHFCGIQHETNASQVHHGFSAGEGHGLLFDEMDLGILGVLWIFQAHT